MLQNIRDRSQGWITSVIIGIIAFTFVLWGVNSYVGSGNTDTMANVNGETITRGQVQLAYERLRQQQQVQLGADFAINHDVEKQLKQQALNQLVTTDVLTQSALKQGLRFTDQQLSVVLRTIPAFQVNGQFSPKRFHEVLNSMLYNERSFLMDMRSGMLINQMRFGMLNSAFALKSEVDAVIKLVNQRRDIRYVVLPYKEFIPKVTVSEQAIQDYYRKHQNEFKTPEQVSVEYLELAVSDLKAQQKVDTAQVLQYYKDNIDNFTSPAKSGQKPEILPFEKVRQRAEQALIQQKAEQQFGELIDKLANLTYTNPGALDIPAKAMGLPIKTTDFFGKQGTKASDITSQPKVLEAAFSEEVLKGGNNSNVVELGPSRAIVLRIKQHKPVSVMPLDMVKNYIQKQLQEKQARDQVKILGASWVQALQKGTSPQQLATQQKVEWIKKTGVGRYEPKVNAALLNKTFQMPRPTPSNKNTIAGLMLPSGDYAVIIVDAVQDGPVSGADIDVQRRVFQEEIEHGMGQLDYELYVQGLFSRAKVETKENL